MNSSVHLGDGKSDELEMIARLYKYGLTPLQSKALIALLRAGPSSAKDLSRNLGVNRVDVYRVLNNMKKRGLVELTLESPTIFSAVPPNQAIMTLLEEEEERFRKLKSNARDVLTLLKGIRAESTQHYVNRDESPTFKILSGKRLFEIWRKMLQSAEDEVVAVWSEFGLNYQSERGFMEPYISCVDRGVKVRVITSITPENAPNARRYARIVNLRHASSTSSSLRYLIIDKAETSISASVVPPSPDESLKSIWTNSGAFIEALKHEFEQMWGGSVDASDRLRRIDTKNESVSKEVLHDIDLT